MWVLPPIARSGEKKAPLCFKDFWNFFVQTSNDQCSCTAITRAYVIWVMLGHWVCFIYQGDRINIKHTTEVQKKERNIRY